MSTLICQAEDELCSQVTEDEGQKRVFVVERAGGGEGASWSVSEKQLRIDLVKMSLKLRSHGGRVFGLIFLRQMSGKRRP